MKIKKVTEITKVKLNLMRLITEIDDEAEGKGQTDLGQLRSPETTDAKPTADITAKGPEDADAPAEDAEDTDDAPTEDKRKFIATVKDEDGTEIEKKVKAFSIADIKAHFGDTFVKAELHPDEEPSAEDEPAEGEAPKPAEDGDAVEDDGQVKEEKTVGFDRVKDKELKTKRDFDFKRFMSGAMTKDNFQKKYQMGKYLPKKNPIHQTVIKGGAPVKEEVLTEMAKRVEPGKFYSMMTKEYGSKGAGSVTWAQIKKVADDNDVLIPAYIRDNKIARGRWNALPKDMDAPVHEPVVVKTEASKIEPKKEEPKAAPVVAPEEKKEYYEKHDFPDVEFAFSTRYTSPRELYAAIEKHHGVESEDTEKLRVGKATRDRNGTQLATYYIVKKGTHDVLGYWTVTGSDKRAGVGWTTYGDGGLAMSTKAKKNRDDNMYGFLVRPQHGSSFISCGTQHSQGPWDKFSAEANVADKYQHYEYDDEFGHGTISVIKVKKSPSGKWEKA